ncbi:Lipoprotein signal peptidase [hydrothermal vent metagenome]|uniref:Lipoprotein signal peptidase n=1 Tax=hydrothermal vent metagenome TaxID=652676 RepID=A0A3B1BBI2_9ZZZZ
MYNLKWFLLSAIVVALDLWTKALASEHLVMYQPLPVFSGFNLTLMHNEGAAFSFLSTAGGWQRWFLSIIAAVVSVVIIVWLARLKPRQHWLALALALVLGGALGNLWDRLTLGYVVDFIQMYYQEWYWPAFNIADSSIFVGAMILILDSLFGHHDEAEKKS